MARHYKRPAAPVEERSVHRKFWHVGTRYEDLRAALRHLKADMRLTPSDFLSEIHPVERRPSVKNLNRFLRGEDHTVFTQNPEHLSALLQACKSIVSTNGEHQHPTLDGLIRSFELVPTKGPHDTRRPASAASLGLGFSREQLQAIHDRIVVPTGPDVPEEPEFPPSSPRFPATPADEYEVAPGRRIYIKDESWNPTGSHKDRWAWEMLVQYKQIIGKALRDSRTEPITLPPLSIISAGSAAFALQSLLALYGLPPLRVILDIERADKRIAAILKTIGAKTFLVDLDEKDLSQEDVLRITDNTNGGIDITTRHAITPNRERFYDWLVYEILLKDPKHIFVPFGTGDLFTNVIYALNDEVKKPVRDQRLIHPRLNIPGQTVAGVHVYGATTDDPRTAMDKLYAAFRPTRKELERELEKMKEAGTIGSESGIYPVSDAMARTAKRVAEEHNIRTELSGIAGLALFLDRHNKGQLAADETVLVVNTGWMYLPRTTG